MILGVHERFQLLLNAFEFKIQVGLFVVEWCDLGFRDKKTWIKHCFILLVNIVNDQNPPIREQLILFI
jgi:hypothetical protein